MVDLVGEFLNFIFCFRRSHGAFFCKTTACDASEAVYPAQAVAPTWKAAVRTGPYCVSACDDFVSIMKDNGIATSIGMPSAAADAPFQYAVPIVFANGKSLDVTLTVGVSLRPGTTTILEGNPPSIDVPLLPSASNRGQYLDAAIAAAKLKPPVALGTTTLGPP